jgi:hypothetical protein
MVSMKANFNKTNKIFCVFLFHRIQSSPVPVLRFGQKPFQTDFLLLFKLIFLSLKMLLKNRRLSGRGAGGRESGRRSPLTSSN